MKIIFYDKWNYPIEGYINNKFRSFIRVLFQILRGNISRIKFEN